MSRPSAYALSTFSPGGPAWSVTATMGGSFPRLRIVFNVEGEGLGPWAERAEPPSAALRAFEPELWKVSCFELFVKTEGEAYHEWNFAPDAGAYAHFEFASYRMRTLAGGIKGGAPLSIERARAGRTYELAATLDLGFSPALAWHAMNRRPVKALLSAILETAPGAQTFWATRHALAKPDFHDAGSYSDLVLP